MGRRSDSTTAPATRRSFRQRSPLAIAVLFGLFGAFLLLSLASSWQRSPNPAALAWVLFALAAVWVLFVRPSVVLDQQGVTLRNLVRDVRIPWPLVDDVEAQWNVKVYVGDVGYTAWAISSSVERPQGLRPGMLAGLMPTQLDPSGVGKTESAPGRERVSARLVAQTIVTTRLEYDMAVDAGAVQPEPAPSVQVTWVWSSVMLLGVPLLAALAVWLL